MTTQNVWVISEDNHGTIGVAASMLAGKQWLIDSAWVTMMTEIWIPQTQEVVTLGDLYGENWEKHFLSCAEGELEDMGFFFHKMELHKEK